MFCVYLVTNLVTGKRYVGKAADPAKRWEAHKKSAHDTRRFALGNAIRKYGSAAFLFEVLEWFETEDEAFSGERLAIVKYSTRAPLGYNLTDGGEGASGCHVPHPNMVGKRWRWSVKARIARLNPGECLAPPRTKDARKRHGYVWHGQCRAQPHRRCVRVAWRQPSM